MNNEQIKNMLLGLIAVLLLIIIIVVPDKLSRVEAGPSEAGNNNDNPLITEALPEGESKELNYIDYDEFEKILETDSNLEFVVVARPTCIWCVRETPILEHIAYKHELQIHYLNTDEFTRAEEEKHLKVDPNFGGTPSHYVIKDGKIIDIAPGARTLDDLESILKEHKLI